MSHNVLASFNPFSLQNGSKAKCHHRTQQIIWYGESRLRQALIVISKADAEAQAWMQHILREELFYLLGYVGVVTAIGQVVEVLILISLLALLDAGIAADSPAALVPMYTYDWWNGDARLARGGRLNNGTLPEALEVHYDQNLNPRWDVTPVPTPQANFGLRPTADCQRCRSYEDLTQDLMGELQSIHQLADGMKATSTSRVEQGMRQAQAVHVLHEQSLLKELAGGPASASGPPLAVEPLLKLLSQPAPGSRGDTPRVSISRKSRSIGTQAHSELLRLISLPPSSLKWVWGADLSEEEVLMLTTGKGKQHSGYNESLPLGVMRRKDTVLSALRTGSAQFMGLAPDIMSVPDAQPYPPWHNDPHFTTLPSDGHPSLQHDMTAPLPSNADVAPMYVTADDAGAIWSDASSADEATAGLNAGTTSPGDIRSNPALEPAANIIAPIGISADDAAVAWSDDDSAADLPATQPADRPAIPTADQATAIPTASDTAAVTDHQTRFTRLNPRQYTAHTSVVALATFEDAANAWSDHESDTSARSSSYDADADAGVPTGQTPEAITAEDAANAYDSDSDETGPDADAHHPSHSETRTTADDAADGWTSDEDEGADDEDADDEGADHSGADAHGAESDARSLCSSSNGPGPFGPAHFDFMDAQWLSGSQPEEEIDPDDEEADDDEVDDEDTDYEEGVDLDGHYYI
ncbi:hypothetical protein BDZ97DRAFT_1764655 [Flammula alnicola]|nr:hypothetical protein BDZ97DRAFT_1764655 [Flammula alnicola]